LVFRFRAGGPRPALLAADFRIKAGLRVGQLPVLGKQADESDLGLADQPRQLHDLVEAVTR